MLWNSLDIQKGIKKNIINTHGSFTQFYQTVETPGDPHFITSLPCLRYSGFDVFHSLGFLFIFRTHVYSPKQYIELLYMVWSVTQMVLLCLCSFLIFLLLQKESFAFWVFWLVFWLLLLFCKSHLLCCVKLWFIFTLSDYTIVYLSILLLMYT